MRIVILMALLAVMSGSAAAEKAGAEMTPGNVFRDCADCPVMVIIPAGSFEMGSNGSSLDDMPLHHVTINHSFALGRTEITQEQWRSMMGDSPSDSKNCGDDCAVESVSWSYIQEFIQKLNVKTGKQYRLPTEAEWEYACRAGEKKEYCGSDNLDNIGWYESANSERSTHPVGRKQTNAWGLYDMTGNVWEWVEDNYQSDDDFNRLSVPTDGSAQQGNGKKRVVRGGSWSTTPKKMSVVKRSWRYPASRDDDVGFRLARTLGAPSTEPASYATSNIPVVASPPTNKHATQSESAASKLRVLNELYKEGAINQKEYEAKKQEILKSM
jgi:formylglycine-generating enzyme required for sulfatase activity